MNNPIPCGRDCPRRSIDCHGKHDDGTWRCEEWGAYQQKEAERKEMIRKAKSDIREVDEYEKARRKKYLRERRRGE